MDQGLPASCPKGATGGAIAAAREGQRGIETRGFSENFCGQPTAHGVVVVEAAERRRGGARTTSSRFWGVTWDRNKKKWQAQYRDANGKNRFIGYFDDEEEAARARDQAIRDAGLEGKRRMNADATGTLVPKSGPSRGPIAGDRSAVVAPDAARAPTETSSKFWGVDWHKTERRWRAQYTDANGNRANIGYFDTQEAAAHAVNAAIRRAGLEKKRHMNPVVDGQLVPKSGPRRGPIRKRRREEPAAESAADTPSTRARRPRRAANYAGD